MFASKGQEEPQKGIPKLTAWIIVAIVETFFLVQLFKGVWYFSSQELLAEFVREGAVQPTMSTWLALRLALFTTFVRYCFALVRQNFKNTPRKHRSFLPDL